jgi:S1-C subfamily serine protease
MTQQISAGGSLLALSNDLADAIDHAGRFTVAVHARHRTPSTGVHWRPGVIVTADHAIRQDDEIFVTLPDGRSVPATLAGRDSDTDLAVLKIDPNGTAIADLAEGASLKVGHLVIAVARAGDDGLRASSGVVSALGGAWRTWRGGHVEQFIALDLNLYPGFSGGPLVDPSGHVLGVNTSALSRRFDLTLPIATVDRVIEQLLTRGRIARGYLGIGMQPVRLSDALRRSAGVKSEGGAIVVAVEPDGPAERGGIFVGDIIVALDGKPIEDTDDLLAQLGSDRVGKALRLRLIRGGAAAEIDVTVGERPQE